MHHTLRRQALQPSQDGRLCPSKTRPAPIYGNSPLSLSEWERALKIGRQLRPSAPTACTAC